MRTPPDWVQLQWGSQRGRAPLVELFARQPANLNVCGCKFEAQIESVLITRHLPTPFWKLMVYGRQEGGKWEAACVSRWGGGGGEEEAGCRWSARCCWLQATTGHPAPGQLTPGAAASTQRKHFDSILGHSLFSPLLWDFLRRFLGEVVFFSLSAIGLCLYSKDSFHDKCSICWQIYWQPIYQPLSNNRSNCLYFDFQR